jgi:hypothetical protein
MWMRLSDTLFQQSRTDTTHRHRTHAQASAAFPITSHVSRKQTLLSGIRACISDTALSSLGTHYVLLATFLAQYPGILSAKPPPTAATSRLFWKLELALYFVFHSLRFSRLLPSSAAATPAFAAISRKRRENQAISTQKSRQQPAGATAVPQLRSMAAIHPCGRIFLPQSAGELAKSECCFANVFVFHSVLFGVYNPVRKLGIEVERHG